MTTLDVFDKRKNRLASIEITDTNKVIFSNIQDPDFKNFINKFLENSIPRKKDLYDIKTNTSILFTEKIGKTDPGFPLALKEFLRNLGCIVQERSPETEIEIKKLLNQFPDNNPDKIYILEHLEELNAIAQKKLLELLQGTRY